MTQFEPRLDRNALVAPAIVRGLLLLLAPPCVAALALTPASPAGTALRLLAEIAVTPGFLAIAGWLAAPWIAAGAWARLPHRLAPAGLCGLCAVLAVALPGLLSGQDWRHAIGLAQPALLIIVLPLLYAPVARALRGSWGACLALAAAAHVVGVIFVQPALANFVFFVAGMMLYERRALVETIASDEPELAIASAPFVAVLAIAVSIRFAQTGQVASLAALGPIALALGLATGPALLAGAIALRETRAGDGLARLGRTAPAIAVLWIPLFSLLIAAANRGMAPSLASALLMAISSLLIVALLADAAFDAAERSGIRRFLAQS